MKKILLFTIAVLTSVMSFAQDEVEYPVIVGLGNDSYVITVNQAGQLINIFNDETQTGIKSAKSLKIVCESNAQLSSNNYDDGSKDLHALLNLSTLRTLDLSEAKVENIDATGSDDYKNPFGLFKNTSIEKYILPIQNGMRIKANVFEGNRNVKSVTIPDYPEGSSYSIGEFAFSKCSNLEEAVIGNGTTVIPNGTFEECFKLSAVLLDDDITSIGSEAFQNCSSIEYLILPDALISIGGAAFDQCINMKTITIPPHVTEFGNNAFDCMFSLTDVYVLGNETPLEKDVFNVNQTTNFRFTGNAQDPKYSSEDYTSTQGLKTYSGKDPKYSGKTFRFSLAVLHYHEAATDNYRIGSTVLSYTLVDPKTGTTWPDDKDITSGERKPESKQETIGDLSFTFYASETDQHSWLIETDETTGSGYVQEIGFWDVKNDPSVDASRYVGWKYFLQGAQIEKEQDVWPESRIIDSRWYSVCFPFDLTLIQFKNAFGIDADLSKLKDVVYDEENHYLKLNFTDKQRMDGVKDNAVFMHAHTPYMIRPSRRYEEPYSIVNVHSDLLVKVKQEGETEAEYNERKELVYVAAAEKLQEKKTVYSGCTDGNIYTFIGNYDEKAYIPKGAYYLGYDPKNPEKWPLGYYRMTKDNLAPWTPTCALVIASTPSGSETNGAKFMDVNFNDFSEGDSEVIVNGIEGPSIKIDVINESDKVYNMNGQVVRNCASDLNTLPRGMYIINGKKVIIK